MRPESIKIGIYLLFQALYGTVYAQQDPGNWIAEAWNDSTYKRMEAMVSFRAKHPLTLQWLDKVELRTQTNDFVFNQQQYTVRFYGTEPAEINYRKRMEAIDVRMYQQLADDALHDAITSRYRVLADYFWIGKQVRLNKEQQDLQIKKTQYLESLFQHQLDAELKDLIQADRKKEKIQAESNVLEEHQKQINQKYTWFGTTDTLVITGFPWIQPDQIRSVLFIEMGVIPVSGTYARLLQNKTQAELENIKLKTDQWNLFEFVQARWRNNVNDDLIREKISLGAGIRIPYSGGKRREQNQIALEKRQVEDEIRQYESEHHLKTKTIKQELESILAQLEDQQKKLQNFEKKFHQPQVLSNPLTRPQDILLIDETILDWKEEIIQLEKKLMDKYVDYLDHTRVISQAPYKNYLHINLEELRK